MLPEFVSTEDRDVLVLLSPAAWPEWFMYRHSGLAAYTCGWKGDPGPQGHWRIELLSNGSFMLKPQQWPAEHLYMYTTGTICTKEGAPGLDGSWKIEEKSDLKGFFRLSTLMWPNWFMYMSSGAAADVRGCKGDPGSGGYWKITILSIILKESTRATGSKKRGGYFFFFFVLLFSSVRQHLLSLSFFLDSTTRPNDDGERSEFALRTLVNQSVEAVRNIGHVLTMRHEKEVVVAGFDSAAELHDYVDELLGRYSFFSPLHRRSAFPFTQLQSHAQSGALDFMRGGWIHVFKYKRRFYLLYFCIRFEEKFELIKIFTLAFAGSGSVLGSVAVGAGSGAALAAAFSGGLGAPAGALIGAGVGLFTGIGGVVAGALLTEEIKAQKLQEKLTSNIFVAETRSFNVDGIIEALAMHHFSQRIELHLSDGRAVIGPSLAFEAPDKSARKEPSE